MGNDTQAGNLLTDYPMKYDPNIYRQLGIGERIEAGDYQVCSVSGKVTPVVIMQGSIVTDTLVDTYIRTITTTPITKVAFSTGATRSDPAGRGRFDLIPYEAMRSLALRYEHGAVNFGDRNWERGQPLSRLLSSMRRHAHQVGYDFSEDHIGAVLWNAAAFVTMCERMRAGILPKELDDIGFFLNEEATKP